MVCSCPGPRSATLTPTSILWQMSQPTVIVDSHDTPNIPSSPGVRGVPTTNCQNNHDSNHDSNYSARYVLSVCRGINSATPALLAQTAIADRLPPNFLIFAVADKLSILVSTMQSIVNIYLDDVTTRNELSNDVHVRDARTNATAIFTSINRMVGRLRETAIDMPTVRPPAPLPAVMPGC